MTGSAAHAFYAQLMAKGYQPNALVDVLPEQRVIYVANPKCASSRIKMTLSNLLGRDPWSEQHAHRRAMSGLQGPKHVGPACLHRLAQDPAALRFTFVRNPYARVLSAWADKFRGKPLIPGDPFIDLYLSWKLKEDTRHVEGVNQFLSFSDFAVFVSATATSRLDAHWQLQSDIVNMPGIALNMTGKVENFAADFAQVLDFVKASASIRRLAGLRVNNTQRITCPEAYSTQAADLVYKAYERDFDEFEYPRAIPRA
jgi:hypothetical protein